MLYFNNKVSKKFCVKHGKKWLLVFWLTWNQFLLLSWNVLERFLDCFEFIGILVWVVHSMDALKDTKKLLLSVRKKKIISKKKSFLLLPPTQHFFSVPPLLPPLLFFLFSKKNNTNSLLKGTSKTASCYWPWITLPANIPPHCPLSYHPIQSTSITNFFRCFLDSTRFQFCPRSVLKVPSKCFLSVSFLWSGKSKEKSRKILKNLFHQPTDSYPPSVLTFPTPFFNNSRPSISVHSPDRS